MTALESAKDRDAGACVFKLNYPSALANRHGKQKHNTSCSLSSTYCILHTEFRDKCNQKSASLSYDLIPSHLINIRTYVYSNALCNKEAISTVIYQECGEISSFYETATTAILYNGS